MLSPEGTGILPGPKLLHQAAAFYKERFDRTNGGLVGAPKFPNGVCELPTVDAQEFGRQIERVEKLASPAR